MFRAAVKQAFKFVGSTIGIVPEEKPEEGSLPIGVYSGISLNAPLIREEDYEADYMVGSPEGNVPLWMRYDHAPNLGKFALKRKIYRAIREKNRIEKLIKINKNKAELYALKIRRPNNSSDELYNLRKQYIDAELDKREMKETLSRKSAEYFKLKMLEKLMQESVESEAGSVVYVKQENERLKAELEKLKNKQ